MAIAATGSLTAGGQESRRSEDAVKKSTDLPARLREMAVTDPAKLAELAPKLPDLAAKASGSGDDLQEACKAMDERMADLAKQSAVAGSGSWPDPGRKLQARRIAGGLCIWIRALRVAADGQFDCAIDPPATLGALSSASATPGITSPANCMMKILVLGGYGVFGGRLAELLKGDPGLTLLLAGRDGRKGAPLQRPLVGSRQPCRWRWPQRHRFGFGLAQARSGR